MLLSLDFSNLFPDHLEVGRFIQSKFGNALLMDKAGYVYKTSCRDKQGRKIYWICREYEKKQIDKSLKCKARATTDGIHIRGWSNEHNHEPPTELQLQNYKFGNSGVKRDSSVKYQKKIG